VTGVLLIVLGSLCYILPWKRSGNYLFYFLWSNHMTSMNGKNFRVFYENSKLEGFFERKGKKFHVKYKIGIKIVKIP